MFAIITTQLQTSNRLVFFSPRRRNPAQCLFLFQNTSHLPGLSRPLLLLSLTPSPATRTATLSTPGHSRVCRHPSGARSAKSLLPHMLRETQFSNLPAILPHFLSRSLPPRCSLLLPPDLCLSARRLQEFPLTVSVCQWVAAKAPWQRNSAAFTVAVTSDLSSAIWTSTTPTSRTCSLPWSKRKTPF